MSDWDALSLSQRFLAATQDARRRLAETRGDGNPSSRDDLLAQVMVYNRLYGRAFLSSRKTLLAVLTNLLRTPTDPQGQAFDAERFEECRKALLRALIVEFSDGNPVAHSSVPAAGLLLPLARHSG